MLPGGITHRLAKRGHQPIRLCTPRLLPSTTCRTLTSFLVFCRHRRRMTRLLHISDIHLRCKKDDMFIKALRSLRDITQTVDRRRLITVSPGFGIYLGCFIPRYACFNIWFHNGKDRLFYVHFLSSEAPLYICLLLAHKAVRSIAPLPQVNLRLPQVTSVNSVVFGICLSMLVAWPFCLLLLFHVWFGSEAFVCFCLVS